MLAPSLVAGKGKRTPSTATEDIPQPTTPENTKTPLVMASHTHMLCVTYVHSCHGLLSSTCGGEGYSDSVVDVVLESDGGLGGAGGD